MPRTDYGPEVKSGLNAGQPKQVKKSPPRESIADMRRDKQRGIKEGSAQDMKLDAMPANQAPPGGDHANPAHAAMAASIAHAILQRK